MMAAPAHVLTVRRSILCALIETTPNARGPTVDEGAAKFGTPLPVIPAQVVRGVGDILPVGVDTGRGAAGCSRRLSADDRYIVSGYPLFDGAHG
jgi:hypothetical protein